MDVLRTKTVEESVQDTEDPERGLRRSLGPVQLTAIGIGVIIGTGIFVLTGEAAGTLAGAGDHAVLCRRGDRLLPGGAVLRGVRVDGAGGRVGLHVLVRQPW